MTDNSFDEFIEEIRNKIKGDGPVRSEVSQSEKKKTTKKKADKPQVQAVRAKDLLAELEAEQEEEQELIKGKVEYKQK